MSAERVRTIVAQRVNFNWREAEGGMALLKYVDVVAHVLMRACA